MIAVPQFFGGELVGCSGGPGDEVRHAEAPLGERGVLVRREQAIREPGAVERLPEAVARPREVVPDGARPQPRVDAHEDDVEVRPEHVGDRSTARGLEVGFRGVHALSQPCGRSGHHERHVVI